ncbi:MAG: GNAT family N-acetyltransferase [Planctomycetaceae bacterium]|nr:GNAT family N-acetyltransferase [Planctomycetaceae bacterium]
MPTACCTFQILEEENIASELDKQIRDLLCDCFPDWKPIFNERRIWHSKAPLFTVIACEDDKVIGHTAVVERTITTTWNFRYNAAGIQGVCVLPEYRHAGIGGKMLEIMLRESAGRGFPFAILYCKEHIVPYYELKGWKLADDSMAMWNQRDLPIAMRSNCPMYYELGSVPLPEGPLDVHSPNW